MNLHKGYQERVANRVFVFYDKEILKGAGIFLCAYSFVVHAYAAGAMYFLKAILSIPRSSIFLVIL